MKLKCVNFPISVKINHNDTRNALRNRMVANKKSYFCASRVKVVGVGAKLSQEEGRSEKKQKARTAQQQQQPTSQRCSSTRACPCSWRLMASSADRRAGDGTPAPRGECSDQRLVAGRSARRRRQRVVDGVPATH